MCQGNETIGWTVAFALVIVVGSGCKTAPQEWRTGPVRASKTACGGWVEAQATDGGTVEGELIAVDETTVYLHDGTRFYAVPRSRIDQSTTIYANSWDGTIAIWTAVGSVASVTHGLWLFLTVPTWVLTGTVAGVVERQTDRDHRTIPLRRRARFPQGLPPTYRKAAERLDSNRVSSLRSVELAGNCPPD